MCINRESVEERERETNRTEEKKSREGARNREREMGVMLKLGDMYVM